MTKCSILAVKCVHLSANQQLRDKLHVPRYRFLDSHPVMQFVPDRCVSSMDDGVFTIGQTEVKLDSPSGRFATFALPQTADFTLTGPVARVA